jgi:phage terminase large subunit-like protein
MPPAWARRLRLLPGYDPLHTAGTALFVKTLAEAWRTVAHEHLVNDGHTFFFVEEIAQRALDFFPECIQHVKGELAGQPFVLAPWQEASVANMFGWLRPDLTRRYREVFLFVPRKNGKSALAAGIILYVLFCDEEKGSEIYSAAADRDQAALVFSHVKGMVLQEPMFQRRSKIYETGKSVVVDQTRNSYKCISAEASTKHGYNSHMVVIDELHAQPNADLVDVLMTSTGARRQPIIVHMTTSDHERPSICNEKHDYASKVRDCILDDPSFLPIIYEAKPDMDWTDPKIWALANPNLGVSVSLEYMEHECKRAQETPRFQNTFKRLHLNIRTQQDILWIDMADWDSCLSHDVTHEALKGQVCFAGLDLATTADLCAFVLYFPASHSVLPFFWLPAETASIRKQRNRLPYPEWVAQGYIRATPGNVCDYDILRRDINLLGKDFNIKEIAIDRWNSSQLQQQLLGDGFEVVPFGQGFASMSAPSKELERLILAKELKHDGHPVLRWNMSNAMVEQDAAGNIKVSKKKSTEKIDGVVALVMGIGRAIAQPEKQGSIYDTRGIIIL